MNKKVKKTGMTVLRAVIGYSVAFYFLNKLFDEEDWKEYGKEKTSKQRMLVSIHSHHLNEHPIYATGSHNQKTKA